MIFRHRAAFIMAAVMSIDYGELKERAAGLYLLTILTLLRLILGTTSRRGTPCVRPRADPRAALGVRQVHGLSCSCAYLADERTGQLTYARFISGLIFVGVPAGLLILQPDFGTASVFIALAMGVLLVAGAKPGTSCSSACSPSPRSGPRSVGVSCNNTRSNA